MKKKSPRLESLLPTTYENCSLQKAKAAAGGFRFDDFAACLIGSILSCIMVSLVITGVKRHRLTNSPDAGEFPLLTQAKLEMASYKTGAIKGGAIGFLAGCAMYSKMSAYGEDESKKT